MNLCIFYKCICTCIFQWLVPINWFAISSTDSRLSGCWGSCRRFWWRQWTWTSRRASKTQSKISSRQKTATKVRGLFSSWTCRSTPGGHWWILSKQKGMCRMSLIGNVFTLIQNKVVLSEYKLYLKKSKLIH